jgi:hypothetical protein
MESKDINRMEERDLDLGKECKGSLCLDEAINYV